MGKSWKRRERCVIDQPVDYKWSSQSYTLKALLSNFKLPMVVQCRDDTCAEHMQSFFFDLRQPILLYSKRCVRKVFARCVKKGAGGTFKELLPEIVIPQDYAGWFKVSKGLAFTKPVPHRTVSSLTQTNAQFFLCTTDFDAVLLSADGGDDCSDDASNIRRISEGEVLRKTGVQTVNPLMLPLPFRNPIVGNKFLMCIDEKENELFIPESQTGLFYEVSDGDRHHSSNSVLQMCDVLDEMMEMPLYVRHVLGDPPPISKFYSPCLKLLRVEEEETVMGTTIDDEETLPLEIQTSSQIKFEIALNTPKLQLSVYYLNALDLCNSISENYITDMKLAVNFSQVVDDDIIESVAQVNQAFLQDELDPDSLCNSQRTSVSTGMESEFGEVEANSEFSIQWDPIPETQRPASANATNNTLNSSDADGDCNSMESLDRANALKFNAVLGGQFVDTEDEVKAITENIYVWQRHLSSSDISDVTLTDNEEQDPDIILDSDDDVVLSPLTLTNSSYEFDTDVPNDSSSSTHTVIIKSPSHSFDDESNTSLAPHPFPHEIASANSQRNITANSPENITNSYQSTPSNRSPLTWEALRDLEVQSTSEQSQFSSPTMSFSEFQKECERTSQTTDSTYITDANDSKLLTSSLENIDIVSTNFGTLNTKEDKGYTFTGDVYICDNDSPDSEIESETHDGGSITDLNDDIQNRFRVVKSKHAWQNLNPETGSLHRLGYSVTPKSSSQESLSTDKDSAMISYENLRINLLDATKYAHEDHMRKNWDKFCMERSYSLPVRTSSTNRQRIQTGKQSNSWEQIGKRSKDGRSQNEREFRQKSKVASKLNSEYKRNHDQMHLISDTSSEESTSCATDSANSSLLSECSETYDSRDPKSLLAAINEMDIYFETETVDGSVLEAATLTKEASVISRRTKVKREIKKKQIEDVVWNDLVDII